MRELRSKGSPVVRLIVGVVFGVGLIAAAVGSAPSPNRIRAAVEAWGAIAPVAYCGLAVALIVALVPMAVVAGVAGAAFGTALGFPLALSAATIAASGTFLVSRWLGRAAVDEIEGERIASVRAWIARRGVLAVVIARLAPIPSSLVSCAGGLTALPFKAFVVGSVLGLTPRVFAYVAVGGSLAQPAPKTILAALCLLAVVMALGAGVARRDRRSHVRSPS